MKKFILLILYSLSVPFCLVAQDTLLLTFQDAKNMALENNVNIKQQENSLRISKINKIQSKAGYLPEISINGFWSNADGQQFNEGIGEIVNTNVRNLGYNIVANYPIFNGFSRLNTVLQMNAQNEVQLNQIESTKQNTIFTLANQYLQVLLDEELIIINQQNIVVQNINLTRIKSFVDANITPISDQYNQEAIVEQAKVQLLTLENQLYNDRAALMVFLMIKSGIEIKLEAPDYDIDKILLKDFNLDSLCELAIQNRPDLKQSEQISKVSKYEIKIARANVYPNLSAYYSYGSNYYSTSDYSVRSQLFEHNPVSVIGLNLRIPVFSNFQNRSTITRAKVAYENNCFDYDRLEQNLYVQVKTAYNNFSTLKKTYHANILSFNAAKLAYQNEVDRFKIGMGNIINLSLANQRYVQAQSGLVQTKYSLIFQKIILDYYTGTLDYDSLFYK